MHLFERLNLSSSQLHLSARMLGKTAGFHYYPSSTIAYAPKRIPLRKEEDFRLLATNQTPRLYEQASGSNRRSKRQMCSRTRKTS